MTAVTTTPALPVLTPLMSFDEASELVLDYLLTVIPMGFWSVSEYDAVSERQVYLHLRDDAGAPQGSSIPWSQSFCQHMVTGSAPQIAPDARAVPLYAQVSAAAGLDIGAYIGVPIQSGDGQLFGTLCAADPQRKTAELLEQHAPLLQLLASLLGQILAGERLQAEADQREETLRWRAFHDELTGLPNRALFNDRLHHALALHENDQRPVAVLTIDVDDFKAVNDTFGHGGGDELLVALAQRLRGAVRSADTLARLGGDEFAILLEHGSDGRSLPGGEHVAQRILAAMEKPFPIGDRSIKVGVSVGVAAVLPGAAQPTAEGLLAQADVALYSAKRGGKFRTVVYHSAMRLPEARDLELREPLRAAIADGGIRAVYQPVVALDPLQVVGVECLARWTHQGTPISPQLFIPLAERSRMLPALTEVMLEQACAELVRWRTSLGHDRLQMAVNVPPDVLGDRSFPRRIAAQVAAAGLHPRQFTLEITEDALLNDTATACTVAAELHEHGFRLALDDFGTGYSSLLHLRAIPLDVLKIDRGFTADVDTDPRTRRFLRALLTMGRDLGLEVVVEGVERESQAAALKAMGATHAQGYLYARPAPAADLDLTSA